MTSEIVGVAIVFYVGFFVVIFFGHVEEGFFDALTRAFLWPVFLVIGMYRSAVKLLRRAIES